MANTKDLDYAALLTVGVGFLAVGMAVGTFYFGPKWVEKQQKKAAIAAQAQVVSKKS